MKQKSSKKLFSIISLLFVLGLAISAIFIGMRLRESGTITPGVSEACEPGGQDNYNECCGNGLSRAVTRNCALNGNVSYNVGPCNQSDCACGNCGGGSSSGGSSSGGNSCQQGYQWQNGQCVCVNPGGCGNDDYGDTGGQTCGNGTCEGNENNSSCPSDCTSSGGNTGSSGGTSSGGGSQGTTCDSNSNSQCVGKTIGTIIGDPNTAGAFSCACVPDYENSTDCRCDGNYNGVGTCTYGSNTLRMGMMPEGCGGLGCAATERAMVIGAVNGQCDFGCFTTEACGGSGVDDSGVVVSDDAACQNSGTVCSGNCCQSTCGMILYQCPGGELPCQQNGRAGSCIDPNYCGSQQVDVRCGNTTCGHITTIKSCSTPTPTPPIVPTDPTPPPTIPPSPPPGGDAYCERLDDSQTGDGSRVFAVVRGQDFSVRLYTDVVTRNGGLVTNYRYNASDGSVDPVGSTSQDYTDYTVSGTITSALPLGLVEAADVIVTDNNGTTSGGVGTTCSVRLYLTDAPINDPFFILEKLAGSACVDDPDRAIVGYTISLTNIGDTEGTVTEIVDTLDSDVTVSMISNINLGGMFNDATNQITWNNNGAGFTLQPGGEITFTYDVTVAASQYGIYENTVTATVASGPAVDPVTATIDTTCRELPTTAIVSDSIDRILLGIILVTIGALAYRLGIHDLIGDKFSLSGIGFFLSGISKRDRADVMKKRKEILERKLLGEKRKD